jgi:hypothetical protein
MGTRQRLTEVQLRIDRLWMNGSGVVDDKGTYFCSLGGCFAEEFNLL